MPDPEQPNQSLARVEPEQSAVTRAAPSPGAMLQQVLERGVTSENVAAVEQIAKLYQWMEEKDAEREFAAAFNALQSEMPKVQAKQPVPNRDGTVRYKFAPYEDIMQQVSPLLLKHGFSVSFSTRYEQNRLIKICTLQHRRGHKESSEFAVRIGSGPPGSTETQADGAAGTYAKRFALCDRLNIVIEKDDDARLEGGTVTPAQAAELERRTKETGSNVAAFLKFAGAASFAEISAEKYAMLDANLRRKESTK